MDLRKNEEVGTLFSNAISCDTLPISEPSPIYHVQTFVENGLDNRSFHDAHIEERQVQFPSVDGENQFRIERSSTDSLVMSKCSFGLSVPKHHQHIKLNLSGRICGDSLRA